MTGLWLADWLIELESSHPFIAAIIDGHAIGAILFWWLWMLWLQWWK